MSRFSTVPILLIGAFVFPAQAQEPPPPPPPSEPAPAPPSPPSDESAASPSAPPAEPPVAAPTMSNEELRQLEEALKQDAAGKVTAPQVPDLSKVNLGAFIPGAQSLNPDIAVILNVGAAAFGAAVPSRPGAPLPDEPLRTGGHDVDHSGFTLQQVELAIGASVDPFLRFDGNLVFTGEGVEIEEAYGTTLSLPFNLQARGGAFYTHFGRQNEQHPHSWTFLQQPLVYGLMLGEDGNHAVGAELSWLSPLPWSVVLIASVQEASGACCSVTYSPEEDVVVPVDSPLDLVGTGAVEQFFAVTDDLSLLWGVSAQAGPGKYLGPGGRAELWGTDVLLRYRPLATDSRWSIELQAEAILRTRRSSVLPQQLIDNGAYAQLVWRLNPQYAVGARYDYASAFADDVTNPALGENNHRGTALFHWTPSHFSRLRFELTAGSRGQGDVLWGAMVGFEVSIGAHGAHAY